MPEAKKPKADDASVDYLVVGHIAMDRSVGHRLALGGTAAYAALTARNMGARVGVHTSASYEPALVDTLYATIVARIPSEYTTLFENTYDEQGARHQAVESVAEKLTFDQLLAEWRNTPVVHIAPIGHELDAAIVDKFPKAFLGVTPQGWMRAWDEPEGKVRLTAWADPDRVLARADAIVVSEDDLVDPSVIPTWAAKTKLLVVTRGAEGADVYKKGESEPYHSPAFKANKPEDPTGAGDVFAAAFFWHVHTTGDWRQAADWANCVASFVVEKRAVAGVPKLVDVEKRWKTGNRLKG